MRNDRRGSSFETNKPAPSSPQASYRTIIVHKGGHVAISTSPSLHLLHLLLLLRLHLLLTHGWLLLTHLCLLGHLLLYHLLLLGHLLLLLLGSHLLHLLTRNKLLRLLLLVNGVRCGGLRRCPRGLWCDRPVSCRRPRAGGPTLHAWAHSRGELPLAGVGGAATRVRHRRPRRPHPEGLLGLGRPRLPGRPLGSHGPGWPHPLHAKLSMFFA